MRRFPAKDFDKKYMCSIKDGDFPPVKYVTLEHAKELYSMYHLRQETSRRMSSSSNKNFNIEPTPPAETRLMAPDSWTPPSRCVTFALLGIASELSLILMKPSQQCRRRWRSTWCQEPGPAGALETLSPWCGRKRQRGAKIGGTNLFRMKNWFYF